MKIYLIVCAVMLALVYLKILADIVEFKRAYPLAVFRKNSRIKTLVDFIKVAIAFMIPLFNVVLFFVIMFCFKDEEMTRLIKEKCETY
jgi:hypothetical protein